MGPLCSSQRGGQLIDKYGNVYQGYASRVAESEHLSKDSRILLAAMGRANNTGHTFFEQGELRSILGKPQPDGMVKPASRATVYEVLSRMRSAGLILPGGGESCVWLPQEFWSRGISKQAALCPVHNTRRGGWASNERAQS